ncbi:hypothetical protein MNBD_NITROSPINAE04-799 [hydrothermal vent metagenome]|uniref:Lipoprotein SmpA/OmlA domain-containing protein n=1 Tax=hydrothermal vent metagenome TaxID=652676 RepID=A0A3B1BYQ0_9ZZZZ
MRVILLISVALLVSGCSTASLGVKDPQAIQSEKVSSIVTGVTTRDELTQMFGEPEMKIPAGGNSYYFYKDLNLNSLWVVFNEDWTVQTYKWSD